MDGCLDDADSGYEAIVAVDADPGAVLGYVCWGRTPMTAHTVDLYWMAVAPEARRAGVGRKLILAFEARLRQEGVRIIRVETSSSQPYAAAVAFYLREGYEMAGRIPDFYRDGDDLLILHRRLA